MGNFEGQGGRFDMEAQKVYRRQKPLLCEVNVLHLNVLHLKRTDRLLVQTQGRSSFVTFR